MTATLSNEYKAHYSIKMPKTPQSARTQAPKKIDDLVELEDNLFELTLSRFAPDELSADPKHRPVQRVRIWDHHGPQSNENSVSPNMHHIVGKLKDCEHFRTDRLNSNKEFHQEMRAAENRLKLVKRGVPLYRVLKDSQIPSSTYSSPRQAKLNKTKSSTVVPPMYTPVEPNRRFDGVNEVMHKIPAKYTGIPPVRKIQFVYPVSSTQPEKVDLVSKINLTEVARTRLKRTKQRSENLQLQCHNEMIDHLNHVNERRLRAAEDFFNDTAEYGLEIAQINAKRSLQRSRLRTMCNVEWWDDFINFAFPTNVVKKNEEKFVERMARHPNLSPAEFINLVREMDADPNSGRCREMLDWINERSGIIDNVTLNLMLEDRDLKRIKKLSMVD